MLTIKVYETVTQEPNGDRDTARHPCSKFEVVLVNGDRRFTVATFDQFDRHWTSIQGSRDIYLRKAYDAAEKLALVFDAVTVEGVEATRKEKEIMDTEAEIQCLNAKLQDLKKAGL